MPIRLIRVAIGLSVIGILLGRLSAAAAQNGPAPNNDSQPLRLMSNDQVQFADGSAMVSDSGANVLTAMPAPQPSMTVVSPPASPSFTPTLAPPPAAHSTLPPAEPAALPPAAASAVPAPSAGRAAPLVPVPESKYLGPAEIEVTSFHSITPGTSFRADVEKTWGKPKESRTVDGNLMQLYSVDPFPRVEVAYAGDKVASLVIRFDHGFPAGQVAEQLELTKVQPVLVSNDMGEILGQAYPERGVLFSFEPASDPSKALKKVTHIVLEPISAEPFVLRSETNIDTRPEFSLHDAEQAIKLQPGDARAHWLRSRALTSLGRHDLAAVAATEAVRLEPKDARFQMTLAETLRQSGQISEAVLAAQRALALSEQRPHVKARALCLLGDLKGTGPHADYKQALQLHMQALLAADAIAKDPHPAIRIPAKQVLLDGHLGALHDIAWGPWREKERSAARWIASATDLAEDLVKTEDASEECRFRVNSHALAADVLLQGKLDPAKWAKDAARDGEELISAATEPGRKAELQWQVASALYDAMQAYQLRGNSDEALRQGELAIGYLEKSGRQTSSPSAAYLLGKSYFRVGAVYANNRQDHRMAVTYFDKAIPFLGFAGKTPPAEATVDLARLGDAFVSMGVSYWSAGARKKAVALTEHGTELIEESVRRGTHDRSVLVVPYSNLAAMNREIGDKPGAARMQELAEKAKGTTMR